ncbi:MAG: hypothetical protein ABR598_05675 [Candidatus Dormibacteria bacterium]
MVRLRLCLLALLALAGGTAARPAPAPAVAAPPAPAAVVTRVPGVSFNFNLGFGDRSTRLAALRRMSAIGVGVDRIDANWIDIEKSRGVYDWTSLDYRVAEANEAGLQPRVILAYGNPLYSARGATAASLLGRDFGGLPPFGIGSPAYYPPDDNPADLAAFARWAAALAARYRDGTHGTASLFEVWNEENGGYRFWEPREDAAWYGDLLRVTHDAVKRAAPGASVAFGGTFYPSIDARAAGMMGIPQPVAVTLALPSQGTLAFVSDALSAHPDLGSHFDAMAYHPYHFPYYAPEVNIPLEGTTEDSMVQVRGLLDRHGLTAKPIWITEMGWPNNTCAYGVSPLKSASYLVRTYSLAWAHGIDQVDWYTYADNAAGPQACVNQEAAFGVIDAAGRPKPAYGAWAVLNRLVALLPFSADVSARLGLPSDGRALRFASAERAVTVVWLAPESMSSDTGPAPPANHRVQVATPPGTTAIYDMAGTPLAVGPTFEASPYPVYLLGPAGAAPGTPSPRPDNLPNTSR